MAKAGPILIAEDDLDDQHLIGEAISSLKIENELKFFKTCPALMDYLLTTADKPVLIISDVNMPVMTGIQLKKAINDDPFLRKKSIPFVFLTTGGNPAAIEEAYNLLVQGYFLKENSFENLRSLVGMIINYWKVCKHPNS